MRKLVLEACDIASVLAHADRDLKADLYAELGFQIRYDSLERVITATAGPCTKVRVGAAFATFSTRSCLAHQVGRLKVTFARSADA